MGRLGIPKGKFWLLSLIVAVAAFAVHKPLFIDNAPAGGPDPTGVQLALFMVVSALSSLAMGIGIAILVFGGRVVRQLPAQLQWRGQVARFCLFWLIAPWWLHEGLHIVSGENMDFLLAIEYGFHVTTYVAGVIAAGMVGTIVVELLSARGATPAAANVEASETPEPASV